MRFWAPGLPPQDVCPGAVRAAPRASCRLSLVGGLACVMGVRGGLRTGEWTRADAIRSAGGVCCRFRFELINYCFGCVRFDRFVIILMC